MRARVRDTEIYFDIAGTGLVAGEGGMRERPVAFLVHGGPGSDHTGLRARYGRLSEHLQLVYFDHRGQGRSARGDSGRYTLDENVEDMEALRQHLGLGPVITLGTSYGGKVAMAHAARYPASVSHLILVATASHAGYVDRARELVAKRGTAEQILECEALFSGLLTTPERMRHYYRVMKTMYARKDDPALSDDGLKQAILAPDALNRAHGPGGFLRSFDLRPELTKIAAPTLIIGGRHDWICPPELSEEIHGLISGSVLRIFEDSSHSVAGDEPQRLIDSVIQFLTNTTPEA